MSCSIDSCRGSILMEFVLVLPIYIFLFGALYLLGEMGLNAIRISTGDRVAAMDAGDREGHSKVPFLRRQMIDEAANTFFASSSYRADEKFQGAWSWLVAGKTTFAYALRSYGDRLVSYPYLRYGDGSSGGGILGTLVGGGRVLFHSKDYSMGGKVRSYNYYTLKRTDLARDPRAYRNWDSWDDDGNQDTSRNHLVESTGGFEQYWYSFVYKENYANPSPDKVDESRQGVDKQLPDQPSGRKEYKRYDMFVTWSQ